MSKLHTSRLPKRRRGNSLVPALFVIVMCFAFSMVVRAETGTSIKTYSIESNEKAIVPDTSIYDINDPRNPDCPCHKAQQLADEEFRNNQQQRGNSNPVDRGRGVNENDNATNNDRGGNSDNVNVNINTNKTPVTTGSSGSQKHYSKFEKFERKMKRWSKKVHRKMKSKNKGTKGGKFRVADCFHL